MMIESGYLLLIVCVTWFIGFCCGASERENSDRKNKARDYDKIVDRLRAGEHYECKYLWMQLNEVREELAAERAKHAGADTEAVE